METAGADPSPEHRSGLRTDLGILASGDEADTDGEMGGRGSIRVGAKIKSRDFEHEKGGTSGTRSPEIIKRKKKSKKKHLKIASPDDNPEELSEKITPSNFQGKQPASQKPASPRVGFVQSVQIVPEGSPKRPFNIRGLSVRPTLPSLLTSSVFSSLPPAGTAVVGPGAPTKGVRRTTSLPDRLNQTQSATPIISPPALPYIRPMNAAHVSNDSASHTEPKKHMSRTAAVILLLVSTGLVAICAEFLVGSINYLVANTGVSEAFVGLIILPIVGNAAEHVTAVTVASKNKMDLAIGVAVGSSIQIGKPPFPSFSSINSSIRTSVHISIH